MNDSLAHPVDVMTASSQCCVVVLAHTRAPENFIEPTVDPATVGPEAKFWIDPAIELAANFGLKPKQIANVQTLIEEHLNEIRAAWAKHFPGGSH